MQRDNYDDEKHKILDILRCLNITFSSKKINKYTMAKNTFNGKNSFVVEVIFNSDILVQC